MVEQNPQNHSFPKAWQEAFRRQQRSIYSIQVKLEQVVQALTTLNTLRQQNPKQRYRRGPDIDSNNNGLNDEDDVAFQGGRQGRIE